ncbi:DUF4189 domain-containing protein [Streptomyces sp. OF8]|uniref:DUF4189 domain-containing protein n=1 Tax=Streptomyces alkaliterrae TaxID=2213162 RepID=A0A7W3X0N3_9ACTN|nr:DUF4189 domain-containing protein [Streptomyces alkaliterrae]
MAVANDGSWGRAWDYRTRAAAERGALSRCSGPNCKVLTSFSNGCGAVVYNRSINRYWGGSGATQQAAEASARANAGGGTTIVWQCTTRQRR